MLLPALNSARGKARTIACMNTMKGFGMAGVQYAANFNECYVPYNLKNDCKWFSNRSFGELLSLPGEDKQGAYYDPQYVRASAVCGEAPILPEFRSPAHIHISSPDASPETGENPSLQSPPGLAADPNTVLNIPDSLRYS